MPFLQCPACHVAVWMPATCACRWLQLLVQLGQQQASVIGLAAGLQLQDSCCLVLAAMTRAPATTVALQDGSMRAMQDGLLRLLHRVLHRCVVTAAWNNKLAVCVCVSGYGGSRVCRVDMVDKYVRYFC